MRRPALAAGWNALLSTRGLRWASVSIPTPSYRRCGNRRPPAEHAFTLLEILLALALTALVLVSLNTFVFSMGELWGRNADVRLFDRHVRAVTRFLDQELHAASLPPYAAAGTSPIVPQEIKPLNGTTDNLLTYELTAGDRLLVWQIGRASCRERVSSPV